MELHIHGWKIMAPDVGIHHFNGHDIENLEYEWNVKSIYIWWYITYVYLLSESHWNIDFFSPVLLCIPISCTSSSHFCFLVHSFPKFLECAQAVICALVVYWTTSYFCCRDCICHVPQAVLYHFSFHLLLQQMNHSNGCIHCHVNLPMHFVHSLAVVSSF